MKWLKKHFTTLLLVAILIFGVGLLLYPTLSDYWNSFHQSRAISLYSETVAKMDTEEYDKILDEAYKYNQKISKSGIKWSLTDKEKKEYNQILKVDETSAMGYIDIPKINCKLTIYHGTSDNVLHTGVGHLAGTSLPVGGKGSHCVLSGHRGLPSAKLFTNLDKLSEGDTFSLTVLNETFTYEVDQIRVVEPTDLSDLQIVDGKDYCTLVTCTPYGINTHRLLVRGHRIANPDGDANVIADALQIEPIYIAPFVAAPILLLLLILMLITTRKKPKKKQRKISGINGCKTMNCANHETIDDKGGTI